MPAAQGGISSKYYPDSMLLSCINQTLTSPPNVAHQLAIDMVNLSNQILWLSASLQLAQQQTGLGSYDVFKLNQENWSYPGLTGPNQILPDDFR